MKIFGKTYTEPNTAKVILPRGDEFIVFKAQAINNFDDFNKLCPEPTPLTITHVGKAPEAFEDDPDYKKRRMVWSGQRLDWMILESLKATPGLTWDKVDMDKPETWELYNEELKESKFNDMEINRIVECVLKANCLSEKAIQEAEDRFLALEQAQRVAENSQKDVENSTPSGQPASDSE